MDKDFVAAIKDGFDLPEVDASQYSPLELAYLGDCVYETVIRSVTCYRKKTSVKNLNKATVEMVRASAQAALADKILADKILSEEELVVYKRGRNSNPAGKAKSASRAEYMKATGLETLVGYLYIEGRYDRIVELIKGLYQGE